MHELSLATSVYLSCRRVVDERGPGRLDAVRLAVGELSAVEPVLLQFAWEAVVAGTGDASAKLEIEWRPARQRCATCGEVAERSAGSWLRLCPRCQGPLSIDGGDELDLLELDYTPAADLEEAKP